MIIASSILSFLFCLIFKNDFSLGLEYLWLLPLSFLFTYTFFYNLILKNKNMYITTYVVIIYSWIRCVFIPIIGTLSGYYTDLHTTLVIGNIHSIQYATLLITYEQLIISLLLFIYSSKNINNKLPIKTNKVPLFLKGNSKIYLIFLLFAFLVYLFIGRNMDLFQFILISADESSRRGDLTALSDVLVRQIMSSGMIFLFLLIVEKCRRAYNIKNKDLYITIALIAAMLLISIIIGERRSNQLYLAFTTAWLLVNVFPLKRKKIISIISITAVTIISLMSIYKFFNAFIYGSYLDAITNSSSNFNLHWLSTTLDSYVYGIRVVSNNVGFTELASLDISNMFFDFFRSIFGLSFLLSGNMLTTSELYNLTIYNGLQSSGHLFSSIGYGNLYLGFLFSPVIIWFNVFVTLKLEQLMKKVNSIEMKFIISYVFIRFATGMFGNPVPLINTGSRFLIINGIIFLIAFLLVKRYSIKYNKS